MPAPEPGDTRQVIPGGRISGFRRQADHLRPLADFPVARGHAVIEPFGSGNRFARTCRLARTITGADWTAVTQHFVVPDDILYSAGRIRDYSNDVEIVGSDQLMVRAADGYSPTDEVECVALWEERRA